MPVLTLAPGYGTRLAYAGGTLFMETAFSTIELSTDGLTWDSTTGGSGFNALASGDGTVYAAGNSATLLGSTDEGFTWSSLTGPSIGALPYVGAAYGNGRLVLAASNGDGTDYLEASQGGSYVDVLPNGASYLVGAKFLNGAFLVYAQNSELYRSTDGLSWTQASLPEGFGSGRIVDIAYGGGFYLAFDDLGQVATSTDGLSWTLHASVPSTASPVVAVAYGKGRFVLLHADGSADQTNDRLSWLYPTLSLPAPSNAYVGLVWAGDLESPCFVALDDVNNL